MAWSTRATLILALALTAPALTGCIGDTGTEEIDPEATERTSTTNATPSWAKPLPETVTGVEQIGSLGPDEGLDSGYQVALDGQVAYVSGYGAGFYTVDIANLSQPKVLAHIPDVFGHDPWVMHYENRTVVANAATGSGIAFIDVTDPRNPEVLSMALGQDGTTDIEGANSHNIAVVPGTKLVYNSRSVDTPGVDIVDATDPTDPKKVATWNDLTCHDISFYMPEDLAFCAGVRETQIWDIEDPENPSVITRIANPAINIHHWAIPANNGTTLIIGDELGGAASPAFNGCPGLAAENPATGGQTTDPLGALWFYDISDVTTPMPQSWISATEMRAETGACTAHFGEVIEDRSKMVIGFLSGGLYTLDFTDVTAPQMIDHDPVGEVVDAQVYQGHTFAVGRDHGMSIWSFTGE